MIFRSKSPSSHRNLSICTTTRPAIPRLTVTTVLKRKSSLWPNARPMLRFCGFANMQHHACVHHGARNASLSSETQRFLLPKHGLSCQGPFGFHKWWYPKMDDLGVPLFQETSISQLAKKKNPPPSKNRRAKWLMKRSQSKPLGFSIKAQLIFPASRVTGLMCCSVTWR